MGSLFTERNLTGRLYFTMFKETTDRVGTVELETQIEAEGNLQKVLIHFQQDGVQPHHLYLRHSLIERFRNRGGWSD